MRAIVVSALACLAVVGCGAALSSTPPPAHGWVRAEWQPNVNWRHGRVVVTRGGAVLAEQVRNDIESAPDFPPGALSCPADFGAAVGLRLRTSAGFAQGYVTFTGCGTARLGRGPIKTITAALDHDLLTIAPHRWRAYLTPR